MKSFSKRFASAAMAAAMVLSLAAVPTTDAQAATGATLTKKTSVQANKSYTYNLKGIKSSQYVKIYKSSGVTVKKGSTTLKNGAKLKGGKTIKLSVKASTKLTGKKYTLKAKVYNSKTKKYVKTVATKDVKVNYSTKGVTLDQTALELAPGATATLKATMTTEGTNSKIKGWNTDKPEVATVKDGVVTAVAEGTATITVMTSNGKTATCAVTVKKAAAVLESAKLIADNKIKLTFSDNVSALVNRENTTVEAKDNVPAVKSVTPSEDGKEVVVEVFTALVSGTTYTVKSGSFEKDVLVEYGKPATVVFETAQAQENVETKIAYKLHDANGIDVTLSSKVAATCIVSVSGTYSAFNSDSTKPTITMSKAGDVATVKVVYNSGATGETDVENTQEITCIPAKAVDGTVMFKSTDNINAKSDCAKFYLGLSDTEVVVEEGKAKNNVYFCAKDGNEVISYDTYEAESSSDDIANVSVDVTSGKYALFTVTGVQKGKAQINITATKNGAASHYVINVRVTEVKVAKKMELSVTRKEMSNCLDPDYTAKINAQLYDDEGNKVDGVFNYEVTTEGDHKIVVGDDGTVKAHGVKARSYTVRVTGSDQKSGDPIVKNISIPVKDVIKATVSGDKASDGYLTDGIETGGITAIPVKLTYQYEFADGRTVIDTNPDNKGDDFVSVRLYAMYNGLFAGYVRGENPNVTIAKGKVEADANSKLHGVYTAVKYGTKYATISGNTGTDFDLTSVSANKFENSCVSVSTNTVDKFAMVAVTTNATTVKYVTNDGNKGANYGYVAKTGTYTVESRLMYECLSSNGTHMAVTDNQAYRTLSKTFEVKYTGHNPTVTVLERNLNDVTKANIIDNMKTDVDMNNNSSDHESFDGELYTVDYAYGKGQPNPVTSLPSVYTVKYVMVEDKFGDITWNYYVPVNQTFKTK